MRKKARLILTQIDNVSEEVLGHALEKIMELGADNVQLIATITKKNRPGNILLIDARPELEDDVAKYLARELKVSGYHSIEGFHVFQNVEFSRITLNVISNGKSDNFTCDVKIVGDRRDPLSMDVEHDFLVEVQRRIRKNMNRHVSLGELRSLVESRLRGPETDITIEIK